MLTADLISIAYMLVAPLAAWLLVAMNRHLRFDVTEAMNRADRAADENPNYVITGAPGAYTATPMKAANGVALVAVLLACLIAYQGGMVIPNRWSAPDGGISLSTGARLVGAASGFVIGWQLTVWLAFALKLVLGIAALCLMLAIAAVGISYFTTGGAFTLYAPLLKRIDGSAAGNASPRPP